jgi:precorrin-2 C20-methyltransferase/precorrin-3B C17-methyltransferase
MSGGSATQPQDGAHTGKLYGVGVGPGDPELLTLKARGAIEACEVIAYTVKRGNPGVARQAAAPYVHERHTEVALVYPLTTEEPDRPGGYEGALRRFYDEAAITLAAHLDAGRDVALLCEGDPFFYGSYMYVHERLAPRYATEVIPGVTSFSAAAAAAGTPLAKREDVLSVIPGTLDPQTLAVRLRASDAAVVLKLGRAFPSVREAVRAAGLAERAVYVERVGSARQRVQALEGVDPEQVPYMSLLLVPTARGAAGDNGTAARRAGEASERPLVPASNGVGAGAERGSLAVVGLGPGAQEWLTPEARAELHAAQELVGYRPYLERVPPRPGQRRHASENRVEAQRARHAIELARGGARVAVVSSGDPGIFAMASAVLEQLEQLDPAGEIELRVIPGLSAMQAVAARVGAPLGHDFCVISLSDRLKPWSTIERRLHAAAGADMVLALYNPASHTRRGQLARAHRLLLSHRAANTPVVLARAVGSAEESVAVQALAHVDLERVDMRTLLIVGSSTTRVIPRNGGPPRVYTPRSYPDVGC